MEETNIIQIVKKYTTTRDECWEENASDARRACHNINIEDIFIGNLSMFNLKTGHAAGRVGRGWLLLLLTNTVHLHSTFHLSGSKPDVHKNHYPNFTDVRNGQLTAVKRLAQSHTESVTDGFKLIQTPFQLHFVLYVLSK